MAIPSGRDVYTVGERWLYRRGDSPPAEGMDIPQGRQPSRRGDVYTVEERCLYRREEMSIPSGRDVYTVEERCLYRRGDVYTVEWVDMPKEWAIGRGWKDQTWDDWA
jgi:hypothetical protein